MPITPFLAHQAFEPEDIKIMSAAFAAACDALRLKIGDDPATRLVAEKVIEFAQRDIRDLNMLRELTLKEFDLTDESLPLPLNGTALNKDW
jgi:hypothetical protein